MVIFKLGFYASRAVLLGANFPDAPSIRKENRHAVRPIGKPGVAEKISIRLTISIQRCQDLRVPSLRRVRAVNLTVRKNEKQPRLPSVDDPLGPDRVAISVSSTCLPTNSA